jgi:ABC-type lipoprotein release transport system permease subunit
MWKGQLSGGSRRTPAACFFNVSPRDPIAFGTAFVVIVVSLAACFLPAWRASRIDPTHALRD